MILYFLIFSLSALLALNKAFFYNKTLRTIFFTIVGVFLCTGYMTGSDWRGYEPLYYDNHIWEDYVKEPGLLLLMFIFKSLGIGFWPMWIIIKAVCFYFTISSFSHFTKDHYSWAFLFFIGYFALFYYIDNPMRNLIAATIYLKFAIPYIEQNKKKQYAVAIVASCFFHLSTLVVAPLYFVAKCKTIPVKTAFISSLFILGGLFLFGNSTIINTINDYFGIFNLYQNRLMQYATKENASYGISLGILFQLILFLIALIRKNQYINNKYAPLIINLSFCYILTLLFGSVITILFRVSMFLFLPYLVCLSLWLMNEQIKDYAIVTKIAIFVFLFYIYTNTITRDYRYVPYSSYLEYVFKEKPSFMYRSAYNFLNSPYKKDR